MKAILRGMLLASALVALSGGVSAGEPVDQFLTKLRERGLFDVAQLYLESLKTNPHVDAATKQTIPFEQARIIVKMSETEGETSRRLKQLEAAKALFDEFVTANPTHSFAGAARVQLGNLMVERAKAWVAQAEREKKPEDKKKLLADAGKEFTEARKVLADAVKALDAKLKNDFPPVAPRGPVRTAKNQARMHLIEAGMFLGNCVYQHAQAFEKGSKERTQYLKDAATAYHDLYTQFRQVLAGSYFGLWEARCYQEMDDLPRALGLYMELLNADSAGDPQVRDLQNKAQRLAMECWNDKRQQKYLQTTESGEAWLRAARGDEENLPDGLAIMYHMAYAYHQLLDEDKRTDPKAKPEPKQKGEPKPKANKLTKVQRDATEKRIKALLLRVISGRSDYRKQAQELYAIYGTIDPNVVPKTFADAYDQAKGKFAIYTTNVDEADVPTRPMEDRKRLLAEAQAAAWDAIKLFRLSLTLRESDKTIDVQEVYSIRYYLTYLYYRLNRYYEAALQGEFLAKHSTGFSAADHAAYIAMASWTYLYNDAQAVNGKKPFETANLVRVATMMTEKWKDSPYTDGAWLMLADIKIREQDFKAAAEYLEKIPAKAERRSDADLKHGQALWSQYLRLRDLKARKLPGAPADDELEKVRDQAEKLLKQGIDAKRKAATEASAVDPALLVSELSLAQLQVSRGTAEQAKAAVATLSKKDGILPLHEAGDPRTKGLALEAMKTLLRAHVATREIENAKKVLAELDKLFVGDAAAGRPLFYRVLGQDVSTQLKTAPPAEQEALEEAFHEFTGALTATPEKLDDNTLIWAAESNLGIAEAAIEKRGDAAKEKVKQLCEAAAKLYQLLIGRRTPERDKAVAALKALQDAKANEKVIEEAAAAAKKLEDDVVILTVRLGRAQRLARDFKLSFDTLSALLMKNENILDAQIEICDTLLDWGNSGDLVKFELARQGVRAAGAKKQAIWGLARTRKVLQPYVTAPAGGEDEKAREVRLGRREKFFETDLKLCRSLLTHAQHSGTPAATKKKLLPVGPKFIAGLVGVLGKELESSKEWYDAYDALLKEFQTALGQEPTGLKELLKLAASGAK